MIPWQTTVRNINLNTYTQSHIHNRLKITHIICLKMCCKKTADIQHTGHFSLPLM